MGTGRATYTVLRNVRKVSVRKHALLWDHTHTHAYTHAHTYMHAYTRTYTHTAHTHAHATFVYA